MTEKLNALTPALDDIPELNDDFFERADLYQGSKLIRQGRPKQAIHKQPTTIRLDPAILDYFKSQGKGWQTKINAVLNDYIKSNPI